MKRFYRNYHENEGLIRFVVNEGESDLLFVISKVDTQENLEALARSCVLDVRAQIIKHIEERHEFLTSLVPLIIEAPLSPVIESMYISGQKAGVGPMATVAGITSEVVGKAFLNKYPTVDILIENGGDLFVHSHTERIIGIYAGDSILSDKLKLKISSEMTPLGICTSAGKLGHSLSFGHADAVVVLSKDTGLADAVATATGNRVKKAADIKGAIKFAMAIDGIQGVLIIIGDQVGAAGSIEFA